MRDIVPDASPADRRLQAELDFVLGHRECNLSEQNRRLLDFLGSAHRHGLRSQTDIADHVLKLGNEFRSDVDPHVRIAVTRLRRALGVFYEAHGAFRSAQLIIPRGRYCLELKTNPSRAPTDRMSDAPAPAFAWTVLGATDPDIAERRHVLGRDLLARLATTPLVHDGALRADRLPADDIDLALNRAKRGNYPFLAEVDIGSRTEPVTMRVWWVASQSVLTHIRIEDSGDDLPTRLADVLVDPLQGILPRRLAKLHRFSRLGLAMSFFDFMATQDRARLPKVLDALQSVSGTELSSPLIEALRIDAMRANYCFCTGAVTDLALAHADDAQSIVERDPYQPFAILAHAYCGIVAGEDPKAATRRARAARIDWSGSLLTDYKLLHALASPDDLCIASNVAPNDTFFADAAEIITAIRQRDLPAMEIHAFRPREAENFWTRSFQCAVAMELGQTDRARQSYAQLERETPGVADFAGRAIVKMIPDPETHDMMLRHLVALS